MKTSETIKTISTALLEAQRNIGVAVKGSDNPYFQSTYADLLSVINAVKTHLNNAGISFVQTVDFQDSVIFVTTTLLHESGEWISCDTPVFCKDKTNPQSLGSGITYSKRYALQAICGLPTTDDDGNAGAGNESQQQAPREKAPIDLSKWETSEGIGYIKKQPSAQAAIAKIEQKYTVNDEQAARIVELYEGEDGQ